MGIAAMPNAPVHALAAVPSGAAFAIYRARNQPTGGLCEAVGGAIGGWVGGKAPDYFDPANCWNHRRFFHSWAAFGTGLVLSNALLTAWEGFCLGKAEEMRQRLATDASLVGFQRFLVALWEILLRTAAGALAGFLAGYASHLVLDAFTVSSLPLFGLDVSDAPPRYVSKPAAPVFVTEVTFVDAAVPARALPRKRRRSRRSPSLNVVAPAFS